MEEHRDSGTSDSLKSFPGKSDPDLQKRTVHSAVWRISTVGTSEGLNFIRTIILARLLGPSQMGLFGMALLALHTIELLSQTGFNQALVQRKSSVRDYMGTAWTVQFTRGILLGLVMYFAAYSIADFFNTPEIIKPVQILALSPLIVGTRCIGVILFQRELKFHKAFILESLQAVVATGASIAYAMYDQTVWALVVGNLAAAVAGAVFSYFISEERGSIGFEWKKFRELQKFGTWIFISTILAFILTRGGDFVVGKILSASALGVYQLAITFSNKPTNKIAAVINMVTFPAFSRIQDDAVRLKEAFLDTFIPVAAGVVFIGTMILALSHDFVALFLGPEWKQAAPAMQWLAVWGVCRGLGSSNSTLFMAIGKPHLVSVFHVVMIIIVAALIFPLSTKFGLVGIPMTLAITGITAQIFRYVLLARIIKGGIVELYVPVLIPMTAMLAGAGLSYLAGHLMADSAVWMRFCICMVTASGMYVLVLYLWSRLSIYPLHNSIRKITSTFRRR